MGRPTPIRLIIAAVLLVALAVVLWLVWRPQARDRYRLTGYVYEDPLYLSAPVSGLVTEVSVVKGQRVDAGAPLFSMDPRSLTARREQAGANVGQTKAQTARQEADLQSARADLVAAQAQAEKAAQDLARDLAADRQKRGAVAATQSDAARAASRDANARRDAAKKAVDSALAQIKASQAQVAQAHAGLTDAAVQLDLLSPHAPGAARVEDVLFQRGEWAAANQPVVALIPDDRVKVRFFVPQAEINRYPIGTRIRFDCDGCRTGLGAVVDFIAPRVEYTPPVIYSRDSRDKLVFLVEARPDDPKILIPGQPLDVEPIGGTKPVRR